MAEYAVYQAMECQSDPKQASIQSDLFSVGLVFYELLTGFPAFEDANQIYERNAVFLLKPSEHNPNLSTDWDKWLQKLCAFAPQDRSPNADTALQELSSLATLPQDITNLPADTIIDNRYRVIKRLGHPGSFAVAYQVFDTLGEVERVLKLVTRDRHSVYERLQQEYKTLQKVSKHPYIVEVIWAGQLKDDTPFIVFEYVNGQDVEHLIKTKAISLEKAVEIAQQTGIGLSHLHKHKVRHQDIKPSNLLVTDRGVRIIDFNIAVSDSDEMTISAGTRRYLPPDSKLTANLTPEEKIDRDLYALGIVFLSFLTKNHQLAVETYIEPRFSILPTKTEYAKWSLYTQLLPSDSSWVADAGKAFPKMGMGKRYTDNRRSELRQDLAKGKHKLYCWDTEQFDELHHTQRDWQHLYKVQRPHTLEGIAKEIQSFVEEYSHPELLRVAIASDRGQILGVSEQIGHCPQGLEAKGRMAIGKTDDPRFVVLEGDRYGLPHAISIVRSSASLGSFSYTTNKKIIGSHGGLFPEEVVVGVSVLRKSVQRRSVFIFCRGEGKPRQSAELEITIDNPNSVPLTNLCLYIHQLPSFNSGKSLEEKIPANQRLTFKIIIPEVPELPFAHPDESRQVEKPTQNLTPQPPSLLEKGENSKPLSLQERGLERGFPDPVKSKFAHQGDRLSLSGELTFQFANAEAGSANLASDSTIIINQIFSSGFNIDEFL